MYIDIARAKMLQATFGLTQLPSAALHYISSDVIAYLSGFSVIFYNFVEYKTISTLNLGENIYCVRHLEFFNSNTAMLALEERPEGACVSVYERTAGYVYMLKHRIFIQIKVNTGIEMVKYALIAHFVSDSRLLVITDFATGYYLLVYDNDQKTTGQPTFSLKISESDVLDSRTQQEIESLKLIYLTEKELVFICNSTIKFIKLTQSNAKVLAPNNMQLLSGPKIFTDGIFMNRCLQRKFPTIPIDTDKLLVFSTKDGALVVVANNTVIGEFKCQYAKETYFNGLQFLNDPTIFLSAVYAYTPTLMRGTGFFENELSNVKIPEHSCGFLAVFGGKGLVHFYGLLISEFFRYIVKFSKSGGTNIGKQFDAGKLFFHLMSYSSSSVVDSLLYKTTPPFDHIQVCLTRNERYFVGYGTSNSYKVLFGLKLPVLVKRLMEIDGLRGYFIFYNRDLATFKDVIRSMLTSQNEEVKKLIAQDQLTILRGEITDFVSLDAENLNIYFINGVDESFNQNAPFDFQTNSEAWLVKPVFSANSITSIAASCTTSQISILTNDRVVRIFDYYSLAELAFCKFPDVSSLIFWHPSNQYLLLAGSDFLMLTQLYCDRVLKLHQFNVYFVKSVAFSHTGDIFIAASGIHLHVFDFYSREELYRIEDFASRITTVQPLFRDFCGGKCEGMFFVTCADGSVSVLDALQGKRERTLTQRGYYVLFSAAASAAYYLQNSTSKQFSVTPAIPSEAPLFCIMTDARIKVYDSHVRERGIINVIFGNDSLSSPESALAITEIRGSATNDVICSTNEGGKINYRKVYKGRPIFLLSVLNYLVICYERGYVIIKDISDLLASFTAENASDEPYNFGTDRAADETVISVCNTRITGLQASNDSSGFVISTEDGLVFSYRLPGQKSQNVRVSNQAREGAYRSLGIYMAQQTTSTTTQQKSISGLPALLYVTVHRTQLDGLYERISAAKNCIYDTRRHLESEIRSLDSQFKGELNALVSNTNDAISTQLSEHYRIKTDHDNKSILLKRYIANNENLFRDSKSALEAYYQRRLLAMNEQLVALQGRRADVSEQLEQREAAFKAESTRALNDYADAREAELSQLRYEINYLEEKLKLLDEQSELLYKLAEDDLYAECDNLTAFYQRKTAELADIASATKDQNYAVKEQYKRLEAELIDQKRALAEKEISIAELKQRIADFRKAIGDNKNEIQNRDQTIAQREKRVLELNYKIRELNKISFILYFKIRELKRTIYPKDAERAELKLKLKEMNQELSQYRINLKKLQASKTELYRKIASLKQQIKIEDDDRDVVLRKLNEVRIAVNQLQKVLAQQQMYSNALCSLPDLTLQGGRPRSEPSRQPAIDRNAYYRALVNQLKYINLTLTSTPNKLVEQREKDEANGNFSKLEQNVVKLQEKVQAQQNATKSSTSGVMQQNAMLLYEINYLRRELHYAYVQANSDCKIDETLLDKYEENRNEIIRLRAVIRAKERYARVGGYFLPDLQ